MVYFFKTPSPKAGRSVRFASSPVKSGRRLLGPTNPKSTVGQYSRTDHTNTVMVARLEPPIPGTTIKIYPPPTFDHWADLPTAVNDLSLTAINLPLLSESPATVSNKPLKNKSILKSTMKNIFPPARAPRVSRSTSNGADPVAFDDNVDIPAALGASPVPDDTPTHPTLYKGSLAFGSPRGSKLTRVHHFPSPNTTSDDDQKLPAKKKRRTSKPGRKAYFDVYMLDENFNEILMEDRDLHYHSDNERNNKLSKQYAAPIIKNIRTSPMATTTNKAANMQTSTNITTTDDKPSKSGTTIDLDGPNITHYAPTNDIYKHLGPTGDNEEEELTITLLCTALIRAQHTPKLTLLPTKQLGNATKSSPSTPFENLCPQALQLPHQWPFSFSCDSHQHSHTQGTRVPHNFCAHSTPEELLDSPIFLFC